MRVYEPGKEKREPEPIPILTEEKNPELAPIVPKRQNIRYSSDPERSRAIAADVRKRRTRPVGVVLILCGLLILAALFANNYLQNVEWLDEGRGRSVEVLEADPNAIAAEDAFITAEELQRREEEAAAAARQSYYQVFQEDISWTSAKNRCNDLGGQLAVINNADEFTMVTQLAQQSGVQGVWVGCHREGGFLGDHRARGRHDLGRSGALLYRRQGRRGRGLRHALEHGRRLGLHRQPQRSRRLRRGALCRQDRLRL